MCIQRHLALLLCIIRLTRTICPPILRAYNGVLTNMNGPNLMAKLSDILKVAQQRGRETNLPYEGSLTPVEAYEILNESPIARLIDVRTQAEVDWVGYVAGALTIEWQGYPDCLPNLQFIEQLKAAAPDDTLLLFLCRSGVRSGLAAGAATAAGFTGCYNVLQGFEGDRDHEGHRNSINGWRASGLPWKQS